MSSRKKAGKHKHLYASSQNLTLKDNEVDFIIREELNDLVMTKNKVKKGSKSSIFRLKPNNHKKVDYQALAKSYPRCVNKQLKTIKWGRLSRECGHSLSREFLRRHKDHLDWQQLSKIRNFTEAELFEFYEYINWNKYTNSISPNLYLKVADRITGQLRPSQLTLEIAQKYHHRIDWSWATLHSVIYKEVFYEFEDLIDFYWASVNQTNIPSDLLWKYRDVIDFNKIMYNYNGGNIPLELIKYKNGQLTQRNVTYHLNSLNLDQLADYHYHHNLIDWSYYFFHKCYKQTFSSSSQYPQLLERFPFLQKIGANNKDQAIQKLCDSIPVGHCLDFWFRLPEELLISLLKNLRWETDCFKVLEWAEDYQKTIPLEYLKDYRDSLLGGAWNSASYSSSSSYSSSDEEIMDAHHHCHEKWKHFLEYLPKKLYNDVLWEVREQVDWCDYLEDLKSKSFNKKIKEYMDKKHYSESEDSEYSKSESISVSCASEIQSSQSSTSETSQSCYSDKT